MKKFISVFLVLGVAAVLAAPAVSFAQVASQSNQVTALQAQVAALLAQIEQLKAQLNKQQSALTPVVQVCRVFNTNLRIGDEGGDVRALQALLKKDGYDVDVTGIFDDRTGSAVTEFQEDNRTTILAPNGLRHGTGYFGNSTRLRFNALRPCGASTVVSSEPQISYVSPTPISTISEQSHIQTVVAPPYVAPVTVTSDGSLTVTLVSANEDKVGTNHVFGSGGGAIWDFPYGNDWKWNLRLSLSSPKTIQSIDMFSGGNSWSTSNTSLYPIVVFQKEQLNTSYGQSLGFYAPGVVELFAYTQIAANPFMGGTITIRFTDGTAVSAQVPASGDIKPDQLLSAANMWLYENSSEDRVGTNGVFSSGRGTTGLNVADRKWKLMLTFPTAKSIKSMTMIHNISGEGWSTVADSSALGKQLYPLVVVYKGNGYEYGSNEFTQGRQLNTVYDQPLGDYSAGPHLFTLYGQPENTLFGGSKLTVAFTDGTSISTTMPSLNISEQPGTTLTILKNFSEDVKIFTPNGGEAWSVGKTYTISFKTPSTNDSALIYLERGYPAGSPKTGVNSSLLIGQTGVGAQSFTYTVPENLSSWPGLGGNYKIKVCVNNCASSDASDGYFSIDPSITQSTQLDQPSIASISPSSARIGNIITITGINLLSRDTVVWIIKSAPGADGRSGILWGGIPTNDTQISFALQSNVCTTRYKGISGSACLEYLNLIAGSYTVYVYKNGVVSNSIPFVVIPTASITITPIDGASSGLKKTGVYRIKWTSSNVNSLYLKLLKGSSIYSGSEAILSQPVSNENFFDWTVPKTLPDGNDYAIRVVAAQGGVFGDSETFSISSPASDEKTTQ